MLSIKGIFVTQAILVVVNGELEISVPFENLLIKRLKDKEIRVKPPNK